MQWTLYNLIHKIHVEITTTICTYRLSSGFQLVYKNSFSVASNVC